MNKLAQVALDVGSDQSLSGAVMTGITELSCLVQPQDKCYFDFYILFQSSSALSSIKIDMGFPSSPVAIAYNVLIPAAAAGADTILSSSNRACIGTALIASATDYLAHIKGVLINGNNAGILQPQFASTGIGTITARAGSSAIMTNL